MATISRAHPRVQSRLYVADKLTTERRKILGRMGLPEMRVYLLLCDSPGAHDSGYRAGIRILCRRYQEDYQATIEPYRMRQAIQRLVDAGFLLRVMQRGRSSRFRVRDVRSEELSTGRARSRATGGVPATRGGGVKPPHSCTVSPVLVSPSPPPQEQARRARRALELLGAEQKAMPPPGALGRTETGGSPEGATAPERPAPGPDGQVGPQAAVSSHLSSGGSS